ncbi:hypothetical protein HHI36_005210 [Cryptolaemus montrouzieri]|uniref:MaoC-like domain-containing protein n=1 Tax=Cryptolaemus montrouzieri TaxID=559131 RepID=A0ABD2NTE3_9CUCU
MGRPWNKINPNIFRDVVHRYLSDRTCKTFKVGDKISRTRRITSKDIEEFSRFSGDNNSIHSISGSNTAIVHGAFLNALVSGVIGTDIPGHGTLVLKQTLNFPNKCFCDDIVTTTVEILQYRKIIEVGFKCVVENEDKIVLYGNAKLMVNK